MPIPRRFPGLTSIAVVVLSASLIEAEGPVPYRDLSRAGAGFYGPGREDPPPQGLASVRLGVIGPEGGAAGRRLRQGVALAVSEANARGGYQGLPYEVVFRADDGPWGMGAKQVTALAYEDSVWVILGGLDGGDAHLAELVAAKMWIPVITPVAADLTIDYANVPWVLRCFPSDDRQARALIRHARDRGCRRAIVYWEGDREGLTGLRRLEGVARDEGLSLIESREYATHTPEASVQPEELRSVDAVLVWGRSDSGWRLVRAVRGAGFVGPILGPAHLLSPEWLRPADDLGEMVVAAPYDLNRDDGELRGFRLRYQTQMGEEAGHVALFAYDVARLAIRAIEQAGLNRARIRDALATSSFQGIAGTYRFDGLGGTSLEPVPVVLRDGSWVRAAAGGG